MPYGYGRALAANRSWWQALHDSGRWEEMDAVGRLHLLAILEMRERVGRAELAGTDLNGCRQHRQLIFAMEREVGLWAPVRTARPKPVRRPRARSTAGDELAALGDG